MKHKWQRVGAMAVVILALLIAFSACSDNRTGETTGPSGNSTPESIRVEHVNVDGSDVICIVYVNDSVNEDPAVAMECDFGATGATGL